MTKERESVSSSEVISGEEINLRMVNLEVVLEDQDGNRGTRSTPKSRCGVYGIHSS